MVNEGLLSQRKRLDTWFYLTAAFALLGPSFGIPVTSGFTLTFFRLAFLVLLVGFIFRFVNKKSLEASYMVPIRWYVVFLCFWILYAVLTLTWVIDMGKGIRYVVFLTNMIALALSFPYFIRNESYYQKITKILFGIYTAIILFAVFESVTLIHLPTSRAADENVSDGVSASITSVFTNQNDLATCITLALPFIVAAMIMLPLSRMMKAVLYGVFILSGYVLFATGSRVNELIVLPLIGVTLLVLFWKSLDRDRFRLKSIRTNGLFLLLAVVLVQVMLSTMLTPEGQRVVEDKLGSTSASISDLHDAVSEELVEGEESKIEGQSGESITVRVNLLKHGLDFLVKSHFMGVGAGNIERWMHPSSDEYVSGNVNKENIHNWWAEILVNFGVITFALYLALYVWLLWRLWKLISLKRSPHLSPYLRFGAVASLAAMTGYFFGGMAMSTAIHFTPMWISYGLALAVLVLGEHDKQVRPKLISGSK
ncbi:O-Antigen ligase [Thermoactinomyces sp. DSM 45891]|uniref:O-antigen ligase family protein n=1 Tax=Thermoactinomyces sp. DSM 45891 TaxID=1761907 RepID=UPI00091072FA|nr:O-antigen ligase family protein [Thermoactinomyces sp. DSM 45891]SFX23552.1 O-Antigen ligase [Thermoactinomyces sp. DSM 45891]